MNWKRFIITAVVASVVIIIYESVFHGWMLSGIYERTADAWRTEEAMSARFSWLILGQIVMGVAFTWLYFRFVGQTSARTGALVGVTVAVIFFGTHLISFAVQPILPALVVYWTIGRVIEGLLVGAIVGALYQAE